MNSITRALALFAQASYDLTDTWHLTLGGRYTEETKTFRPDQVIFTNYYAGISQVVPPGNPLAALGRAIPAGRLKNSSLRRERAGNRPNLRPWPICPGMPLMTS